MKRISEQVKKSRTTLCCGHCKAIFTGTTSQANHLKYEQIAAYCSPICRRAAFRKKICTEIPQRGPCKHCGEMFKSRTSKQYCGMDCYTSSRAFKAHTKRIQKLSHVPRDKYGEYIGCLECGEEIYRKPSGRNKYCSKACYRLYMAKRFDRWIANPQEMSLPQCYDEFMIQDELPCLIEGCDWVGQHLSAHVNLAHGIIADDFKRAAGFNLSTGLVGLSTHKKMVERNVQVDQLMPFWGVEVTNKKIHSYYSEEAREHHKKARALLGHGPQRECLGCGKIFQQGTVFGRALYCTFECRDDTYARQRIKSTKPRERDSLGRFI